MSTYRLVGMPHYRGTRPGLVELWMCGEVRELPDESAEYMATVFPGAVELVSTAPQHAAVIESPPMDRMIRRKKGA